MHTLWHVAFLLFIYAHCDFGVNGVAIEIDLRLTSEQKKVMDKFKRVMIPKLPHKWMHDEIYLVRWLRARNFDLKKSEEFLIQNLKWRKANKMDTVHLEDWTDMAQDFPYFIDGHDKTGRPIITAIARDWDIRNAVVTGRLRRALRYLDKGMDECYHLLRKWQLEGKNVTQFMLVLHMGAFNLYQHGCPRCVSGILEFVDSYENHFPGMADKIMLVATPPVFETIAVLVREAQSPLTREAMKIYGLDPKEWKKALLDLVDADQLTPEFGGTKDEKSSKRHESYNITEFLYGPVTPSQSISRI